MVLVLFDIDGTLLTSDGIGRRSIEKALEGVCNTAIDASGVTFSGRTDPAIVRDILSGSCLTSAEVENFIQPCLDAYAELMDGSVLHDSVSVLPGVLELLDIISNHPQLHQGLVTGNLETTAMMKLAAGKIEHHFEFGAYGSDHEDRNQLPGIAHKRALHHLGIDFKPENLIVVGDTEHDITCSRYFGAKCIAVSTGWASYEDLKACNPDLLVPSLTHSDEIMGFIEGVALSEL